MALNTSYCTITLGIQVDLAAEYNHKHLFTATACPGQSPLPRVWPTLLAPPHATLLWVISRMICGTAVYKSSGLFRVIYHILVTIYYSISFVKSTDFFSSDSILDENHKNSKDAAIPKNSHDHIYSATALSQPLHYLFPTLMKKEQRHGLTLSS